MKNLKKIKHNTTAVTSIILALLLLGLLAITLTTIQTVYVPRWVEQHEGLHMHEVAAQFADLKHAIDIQTVTQDKTPIATPITLGTEQQSFLTTSRAYGSVHIDSNSFSITLINATDQLSFSLDTLYYASRNNFYVDQSYILEAGAILINQPEGYIMSTIPPAVYNDQGYDLAYTFVNISERGGKTDIGGYGTYLIQTNFSSIQLYNLTNITTMQITSGYPNAWHTLLNNTFQDLGLNYGTDFTVSTTESMVDITIAVSAGLDISLEIVKIYAQISPGRIG